MNKPRDDIPLVVTRGGVPFEDQAEGLRLFKEACLASKGDGLRRWTVQLIYMEIAHLLSYHWEQMESAAKHRKFTTAEYHRARHEELHALLSPPGPKDSQSDRRVEGEVGRCACGASYYRPEDIGKPCEIQYCRGTVRSTSDALGKQP